MADAEFTFEFKEPANLPNPMLAMQGVSFGYPAPEGSPQGTPPTVIVRNEGWDVHTFSIAEEIADILGKAPLRKIWLAADQRAPQSWEKTNASLANAIANGALQDRLEAKLTTLEDKPKAILLVSDLEALHPFMRIGVIEGKLQGKFHVPTVFFYPGVRTGKTRLKFLGFYPEDGNYRSVHVGG